jgi:hypothetical protein
MFLTTFSHTFYKKCGTAVSPKVWRKPIFDIVKDIVRVLLKFTCLFSNMKCCNVTYRKKGQGQHQTYALGIKEASEVLYRECCCVVLFFQHKFFLQIWLLQVGVSAGPDCKAVLHEVTQLVDENLASNGKALKTAFGEFFRTYKCFS